MINSTQKLLLEILGSQLFGKNKPQLNHADISEILKEAKAQSVFSSVFSAVKNELKRQSPKEFAEGNKRFFTSVITNTNNFLRHGELHELMSQEKISYSVLKGIASAYYYPEPSLRDMGDVDFLVYENDLKRAGQALKSVGLKAENEACDGIHIVYRRPPSDIWEMHRSINGIPNGKVGEYISLEVERTIETAEPIELENVKCLIPDKLHHGLIMLLHTASHMTSEGIGLRHLCDWAVFENRFSDEEFRRVFEEKLKRFGLWRFAQILTLVSERYLGAQKKSWAREGLTEIGEEQLEAVITDILNGGNFGKKDMNRYREIKYISNRGERTVDNKNVLSQAFGTLNKKAYSDFEWINKNKCFLPIGWLAEGGKYIGLLVTGKRKTQGTANMLKEASRRKDIYSKMKLFEISSDE